MNVILIVETFVAFVIAVTLHEAAHAGMASLLGDSTAVSRGRLSLSPRRQMATVGTIVALVLSVSVPAGLGWGKPMEIDARRMRVGPNVGTILVALAGPAVNALLGIGLAATLHLIPSYGTLAAHSALCGGSGAFLQRCLSGAQPVYLLRLEQFGYIFAITNILLALLNLIPLYPLDGYHLLFALLPSGPAVAYRDFSRYMEVTLLAIFFVIPYLLLLLRIASISPGLWFAEWSNSIASIFSGGAFSFYLLL